MLKTFRKLVKQFQSIPEREFRDGRTLEQSLAYLQDLGHSPGQQEEVRRYLYAHQPDLRQEAARILRSTGWQPEHQADRHLLAMASGQWPEIVWLQADPLLRAWESEVSLASGAYWTPVVFSALCAMDPSAAASDLKALLQEQGRSQNTKSLALWCLGRNQAAGPEELVALYQHEANQQVQRAVIQALRLFGTGSVSALTGLLGREGDEELCLELALALAWLGEAAVPGLTSLLASESRLVREYAGLGLLGTANPQGISCMHHLKSSGRDGRLKALINEFMAGMQGDVSTWGELFSPDKVSELLSSMRLIQAMATQDDEPLLRVMLGMLTHRPSPEVVTYALSIMQEADAEDMIFEAAMVLGACCSEFQEARAGLESLVQGNPLLRTYATLALITAGIPVMPVLAKS